MAADTPVHTAIRDPSPGERVPQGAVESRFPLAPRAGLSA